MVTTGQLWATSATAVAGSWSLVQRATGAPDGVTNLVNLSASAPTATLRLSGYNPQAALTQRAGWVASVTIRAHIQYFGAVPQIIEAGLRNASGVVGWLSYIPTSERPTSPATPVVWEGPWWEGLSWEALAGLQVEISVRSPAATAFYVDAISVEVTYEAPAPKHLLAGVSAAHSGVDGGSLLARRRLTGAALVTTSAEGDLTDLPDGLVGTARVATAATGAVLARRRLTGGASVTVDASGTLATSHRFGGTAHVATTATAGFSVTVQPLPTVYTGSQVTGWELHLTSRTGAEIGVLQVVEGSGSHDWTLDAEIPVAWRCTVLPTLADGEALPPLEDMWVRLVRHIGGRPRTVLTGPITSAPRRLTDASALVQLAGMDPTWIVQQAGLRWHQVYDTGTPVVATVRSLLSTYAPAVTAVIEPADDTLREPLDFQAGESVLTVINRLLEAAGYTWLAPRADGTLWSDRWTPPATRPIALTFDDHTEAGYLPEVDVDDDWLTRPTEVVARTSGSQAVEAVVGRWPDYLPDAPRTEVITVDATTVEVATLHARRRWEERQQATHIIDASGPWQPIVAGEVARFAYDRHGFEVVAEVSGLGTTWDLAGMTDYALTGVAS